METLATRLTCPGPAPQCENADKNPKLDSYGAADNAYNSRYEKMRRSYNVVRKIGKKVELLEAATGALPSGKRPPYPRRSPFVVRAISLCYSPAKS